MKTKRPARVRASASLMLCLLTLSMSLSCDRATDTQSQTPRQAPIPAVSFTGPTALLPVPELSTDLIRTTNIRTADFPTLGGTSIVVTEVIPSGPVDDKADHPSPSGQSPMGGVITILRRCTPSCEVKQIPDVAKLPVRTHVIDFDGDADNDIVVADLGVIATIDTNQGRISLLRNDGRGHFIAETIADGLGRVACAEAADFDNDGDMDLVGCIFGHINGSLSWFEQTGPMTFEEHVLDPRPGYIHAFPVDIDGDGDLDIPAVVSQESEEVVLFRGDGQGNFSKDVIFRAGNPCFGMSGLEPVDFDGDGDLDLLVTNGDMFDRDCKRDDVAALHGLDLYTNDGSGGFSRRRLVDFYGAYSVRAADFDGDGDMDIVLSTQQDPQLTLPGYPNRLVWYENDAGEFLEHVIPGGGYSAITIEVLDTNDDGRPDLLTGSMDIQSRSEGQRLGFFFNRPDESN